jgi:hypothetical protein
MENFCLRFRALARALASFSSTGLPVVASMGYGGGRVKAQHKVQDTAPVTWVGQVGKHD